MYLLLCGSLKGGGDTPCCIYGLKESCSFTFIFLSPNKKDNHNN